MTLCGWDGVGGWVGGVGCYDQLCCPTSPKLLLLVDLGLVCDNYSTGRLAGWFKADWNASQWPQQII